MATIKSLTSLEQSKKLAKILPLESSDMSWVSCDDGQQKYYQAENRKRILNYEKNHWLPCWSLASLLSVLPEIQGGKPVIALDDNYITYPHMSDLHTKADNIVDACVDMIERLHELNLL